VDIFAYYSPYTRDMSRYDRPSHQVYMFFFMRSGWQVQFLEANLIALATMGLTSSATESLYWAGLDISPMSLLVGWVRRRGPTGSVSCCWRRDTSYFDAG